MLVVDNVVGDARQAGSWWMGEAGGNGDVSVLHGLEIVVAVANEDYGFALLFEMLHNSLFLDDAGNFHQFIIACNGL